MRWPAGAVAINSAIISHCNRRATPCNMIAGFGIGGGGGRKRLPRLAIMPLVMNDLLLQRGLDEGTEKIVYRDLEFVKNNPLV